MPEAETQSGEPKKLNAEEQKAFVEAQKTTNEFVQRISQPGALVVPVDTLVADDDARVLISIPTSFTLTLDDHRRVKFDKGIASVPVHSLKQIVAEHWYVKANGCKIYSAPRKVEPLGSSTLADTVVIGKEKFPLAQFVAAAQASTGLSTEAWNGLPEEERDEIISGIIKARQDGAAAKAAKTPAA